MFLMKIIYMYVYIYIYDKKINKRNLEEYETPLLFNIFGYVL